MIVIGRKCKSCLFLFFLFTLLTGNAHWTKTGTQSALTARVEPSSDVGNVGATFDTVARFLVIPPYQSTADTKLNDASGRTEAQTMGVAMTKNNVNGVVLDNILTTNDSKLVHLDSDVTGQDCYEECPSGKTGTTMFC